MASVVSACCVVRESFPVSLRVMFFFLSRTPASRRLLIIQNPAITFIRVQAAPGLPLENLDLKQNILVVFGSTGQLSSCSSGSGLVGAIFVDQLFSCFQIWISQITNFFVVHN